MILGFDIGNTHMVPILYNDNGNILQIFRLSVKETYTEDSLFATLKSLCDNFNVNINEVKDIVVSSVVPHLDEILEYFAKKYFNVNAIFVNTADIKHEIVLNEKRGADRIVDILECKKIFPNKKLIIIDLGTTTTFDVINDSEYIGGCIFPGINLSINSLFNGTAKLPEVKFKKPETTFVHSTVDQINAGIYYSNVGAIRELIKEYKKEIPEAYTVATGGQGKEISEALDEIDTYIPDLGPQGIFTYYEIIKKNNI